MITAPAGKLMPPRANRFSASASHTWGARLIAATDSRLRPQAAWPKPGPTTQTLAAAPSASN
ncbi:hypothetical protein D3C83_300140 [compost metagenome]